MPPFEMREVEMSLCEYDKYVRLLLGEGKSKRTYPGGCAVRENPVSKVMPLGTREAHTDGPEPM